LSKPSNPKKKGRAKKRKKKNEKDKPGIDKTAQEKPQSVGKAEKEKRKTCKRFAIAKKSWDLKKAPKREWRVRIGKRKSKRLNSKSFRGGLIRKAKIRTSTH